MSKIWIFIVGLVVVLALYVGGTYNSLVTSNETVDAQWAKVETQYQRRFDLIPNLVNSVRGVLTQEQTIFTEIAEARTRYSGATSPDAQAAAASEVEGALGRLLVIVENYPVLASSNTVRDLMSQLEGSENRISVERSRFNDEVRNYNLDVKRFPRRIVASIFGFGERAYFESAEGTEVAPTVNLE
jgi:LemA protein